MLTFATNGDEIDLRLLMAFVRDGLPPLLHSKSSLSKPPLRRCGKHANAEEERARADEDQHACSDVGAGNKLIR
jgi:hypothetical protein